MTKERRAQACDCDCVVCSAVDAQVAADAEAAALTLADMSKPEDDSSKSGVCGSAGINVNTSGVSLSNIVFENKAWSHSRNALTVIR